MYGKLFTSFFYGSIMMKELHVRYTLMSLFALCDAGGYIDIHPRQIAAMIGIDESQVRDAIDQLSQPDPDSRSTDEEGRRLIPIRETFGWKLVNFEKYRELSRESDRREYMKKYMREMRKPVSKGKKDVNSRKQALENVENSAASVSVLDSSLREWQISKFQEEYESYPTQRRRKDNRTEKGFNKSVRSEEDLQRFRVAKQKAITGAKSIEFVPLFKTFVSNWTNYADPLFQPDAPEESKPRGLVY